MFRRLVLAAIVAVAPGFVGQASAQERLDIPSVDFTASLLNNSIGPAARTTGVDQFQLPIPPVARRGPSALLNSLYVSTAVMQVLDMHSTLQAFKAGAVEGNPLMGGVARNPGTFVAVKAAVAASTILATRQIAKRSRVGAVVTMVAINSAYAMIVSHNYSLARGR